MVKVELKRFNIPTKKSNNSHVQVGSLSELTESGLLRWSVSRFVLAPSDLLRTCSPSVF